MSILLKVSSLNFKTTNLIIGNGSVQGKVFILLGFFIKVSFILFLPNFWNVERRAVKT